MPPEDNCEQYLGRGRGAWAIKVVWCGSRRLTSMTRQQATIDSRMPFLYRFCYNTRSLARKTRLTMSALLAS